MSFIWNRRTPKRVSPPGGKFSDSDLGYNGTFDDDYVHKNHVTVNYTGKGVNFAVKSKGTVDLKGQTLSNAKPKTSFSTKIVTTNWDSAVEAKLDNKGTIRLWSDLGTYDFGFPLTVTGKLKTNNAFDGASWAAQLAGRHGDVQTYNRLHFKKNGVCFWNGKVVYERGDVLAGVVTKLSTATFLLSKLTVFSAYRLRSQTLFAEFANRGNGLKSDPTEQNLTIATTYNTRNNDYALKLNYDLLNKADPITVAVGTVARINSDTTLRATIDNKTTLSIAAKYLHSKNLTLQVGSQVVLNKPDSFTRDDVVGLPLGVALNFSFI